VMTIPQFPPGTEDEASYQHCALGDDHQNRTVYTGDDGLLHVKCDCGWDSANWEAE